MALNRWIGMGRITHPLEMKQTSNGTHVLSFTVAVDRDYADANGQRQTDFIDCVAWGHNADFIGKYFDKGRMICVEGALNKRQYTNQNNEKRYVTEVKVDKVHFTGEAKKDGQNANGGFSDGGYGINEAEDFGEMTPLDEIPF